MAETIWCLIPLLPSSVGTDTPLPPGGGNAQLPIGSYSRLHRLRRCIGGTAYSRQRVKIFKFCLTRGAVYDIF